MSSASHKAQSHKAALDGVRALAITMVVLVHLYDIQMPPGTVGRVWGLLLGAGWMGVPLFFVLSGFLVGGPLVEKIVAGTFSFARFYMDRTLRIFPAAYAFLIIWGALRWHLGWNIWTLANFLYVGQWLGIDTPTHFWSLQIEEQFYTLAPLLVFGVVRHLRAGGTATAKSLRTSIARLLVLGIVVEQVVRWYCLVVLEGKDSLMPTAYMNGLDYLDLFFAGTLLALWHKDGWLTIYVARVRVWFALRGLSRHAPSAVLLALFVPLAFVTAPVNARIVERNGIAFALALSLLLVWCSAVVAWFAVGDKNGDVVVSMMSSVPARLLAKLSYSIYVWHWMFLSILRVPAFGIVAQGVFDMVTLTIIGGLSYLMIEKPFLLVRDALRGQSPMIATVAPAPEILATLAH